MNCPILPNLVLFLAELSNKLSHSLICLTFIKMNFFILVPAIHWCSVAYSTVLDSPAANATNWRWLSIAWSYGCSVQERRTTPKGHIPHDAFGRSIGTIHQFDPTGMWKGIDFTDRLLAYFAKSCALFAGKQIWDDFIFGNILKLCLNISELFNASMRSTTVSASL